MSVKEWRRVETGAFAGYLADIKGLKSDEIRLSAHGEGWPFIIPESGHGIYRFGGWIVEAVVNEEEGAELIFRDFSAFSEPRAVCPGRRAAGGRIGDADI